MQTPSRVANPAQNATQTPVKPQPHTRQSRSSPGQTPGQPPVNPGQTQVKPRLPTSTSIFPLSLATLAAHSLMVKPSAPA